MSIAFADETFEFEFVRNLGLMYYGGADLGDMLAAANRIDEPDFGSWYEGWRAQAVRVEERARTSEARGHLRSAAEGYLRSSTYHRMSEFFLHGNRSDPRILSASHAAQQAYSRAAALAGPTWEQVEIPYEGTTMPGYLYRVDDTDTPRPTVIFHGGYDSSLEELGFFGALAAVRRGYHCLTFDGPGQGRPAREQQLFFRHDWENVVAPALDFVIDRPFVDPSRVALMGLSLGGYLAARAAAFEPRFAAVVLYDGMYSFHETVRSQLPADALARLDAGDADECDRLLTEAMRTDPALTWMVTQGFWSFGVQRPSEFLTGDLTRFTLDGIADRITMPSLVLRADGETIGGAGQADQVYAALPEPKQLVGFGPEDGAQRHCQAGAYAFAHQRIFDWLDETLPS